MQKIMRSGGCASGRTLPRRLIKLEPAVLLAQADPPDRQQAVEVLHLHRISSCEE
jgi:hypothetical protein